VFLKTHYCFVVEKKFLKYYTYSYIRRKTAIDMPTINEALLKLKESKFRAGFHLSEKERAYVADKGMDVVRAHAQEFIRTRLAPANPPNDGKQTPMRGHPVFVAQHACACCCRGCLEKWYKVPQGRALSDVQQEKIVNLLMAWIAEETRNED
jgi:exodeoxyribonuclease V alpha subunit